MPQRYPKPSPIFTFKGFMAPVHCVFVDEDILYAGTQDGKVHLWSLQTYRELQILEVGNQPLLSLYKVQSKLIIQDKETTISVWKEFENGDGKLFKEINNFKRIEPALSFCKSILFKTEDSSFLSCFNILGNTLKSSNLDSKVPNLTIISEDPNVRIDNSPDNLDVKIGAKKNYVEKCTDLKCDSKSKEKQFHKDLEIKNLSIMQTTSTDPMPKSNENNCDTMKNLSTNKTNNDVILNRFTESCQTISNTAAAESDVLNNCNVNHYIIVPYDSKEITIFSVETKRKITKINMITGCHKVSDSIMCLKFIKIDSREYLIVCTEDGYITLYNIREKNIECQIKLSETAKNSTDEDLDNDNLPDVPMCVDFDCDTMRGLVGTNSNKLYCFKIYTQCVDQNSQKNSRTNNSTFEAARRVNKNFDSNSSEPIYPISTTHSLKMKLVFPLKHSGVSCIQIRNDGKIFILSFWDGNGIYLFDWHTLKCISYIDLVYTTVHDIYYFKNNNMVAIASDGKVSLWGLDR